MSVSLVDYDASSSDEDDDVPTTEPLIASVDPKLQPQPQPQPQPHPKTLSESHQQHESFNPLPQPALEKLPDASELLNSTDFVSSALSGTDHSSLVAAAMAQSISRKRDSMSLASPVPRSNKVPKGTLPHSKNSPDTAGRMLVPPQLNGRSNIVTEDINKLFVKKQAEQEKKVEVPQSGDR